MTSGQIAIPDPLTPVQAKAGRALLGWSQADLAQKAAVAVSTVADFERGLRSPVQNNLAGMREALVAAGLTLTGGGAVFSAAYAPKAASAVRTQDLRPVRWIDTDDLAGWADRMDSRAMLPELLRRLMIAKFGYGAVIRFASGGATQVHGWDGQTELTSDDPIIPSGKAVWEIGVTRDITRKARDDFEKRTKDPGHVDPSEQAYVFVTPRPWGDKDKWLKDARSRKVWRSVHVIDGVDLAQLLEQTPAVALWFANEISVVPKGIQLVEDAWQEWSHATARPMSETLVLSGRDEQATEVHRWLNGNASAFSLRAESTGEAIAFLYASIDQYGPERRDAMLSRAVVVSDPNTAREIANVPISLIIALSEMEPEIAALLAEKGHHVYLAYGSEILAPTTAHVLARASRYVIEEALKDLKMEEDEARQLARDSAGSLTVMRRLLAPAPGVRPPSWSRPEEARKYLPILLAGAWDEANEADVRIISAIAGGMYQDVVKNATQALALPESPVRHVGSVWKIASPRDAWFRLSPFLTKADMTALEEAVMEVLGADSPEFERRKEDNWYWEKTGPVQPSGFLREGLAETLALIGVFGSQHQHLEVVHHFALLMVRKLLKDAPSVRWWSLGDHLRELAEASPEEFLAAVDQSIAQKDPPILVLFDSDDRGVFGKAHHADLLWGLELLAWSPDYLATVTDVLMQLTAFELNNRWGNRPSATLRQIYLPWMPQTFALQKERFEVLGALRSRYPAQMWDLTLSLYPKGHDSSQHTAKPIWRAFDGGGRDEIITNQSVWNAEEILAGWIEEDIGVDVDRWVEAIGRFTDMSPRLRAALLKKATILPRSVKSAEARKRLTEVLRQFIHRNRMFAEAGWVVGRRELDALERVYEKLRPKGAIEDVAWLFNTEPPPLLRPPGTDFREAERVARRMRGEAIAELFAAKGADAVWELALQVNYDRIVGQAFADIRSLEEFNDYWRFLLNSPDDRLRDVTVGAVLSYGERLQPGWHADLLARAKAGEFSANGTGLLYAWLPQGDETYDALSGAPAEVQDAFWKQVFHYRLNVEGERLAWAIKGLCAHGRQINALELVAQHTSRAGSDLLEFLLEAVLAQHVKTTSDGNDAVMFQYYLEQIFSQLDEDPAFSSDRLAQLEWVYLRVLENSRRPPKALYAQLARSPEFFAEVVSAIYRSDSGPAPMQTEEDREASRTIANQAYTLLHGWHSVPGSTDDGIDAKALNAWVDRARTLCRAAGRGEIANEKIGEVFAYAPPDAGGPWPCKPVRDVIERVRSKDLESGLYVGTRNKRGVTSRGMLDGGQLERGEAAFYRGHAQAVRLGWPRTAAVLERLARSYEYEAKDFDNEAARRQW